jgi:RNA polymerase sigma factor (sigma-70 family)
MGQGSSHPDQPSRAWFATTQWSVVLAAKDRKDPDCRKALEALCQSYWYPLYSYVRRQGRTADDAADLTQEFFTRLLEKDWLADVSRNKGRFRSFLLAAMGHFLANEYDKAKAVKRGGKCRIVPLDVETAETRYSHEPADLTTPQQLYERQWALTLLDRVMTSLQDRHARDGKAGLFAVLKPCLTSSTAAVPYAKVAAQLGRSEGAVRVAVHRLRQQYRELLREEISQTVSSPDEVEPEIQHLMKALTAER